MSVSHYQSPTRICCGPGVLAELRAELDAAGASRTAVVADRGVAETGLLDQILNGSGVPFVSIGLVDPNPGVEAAEALSAQAIEAQADAVLGVGGGSGLSAAKAVAIRLSNDGPLTAYEGVGHVRRRPKFTIAVPTTAGSGSEVSNALVLHEAGRPKEIVIRGLGVEPDVAMLDGEVLIDLPRTPMLYAALDALTHALEALWTRGRNSITDALAVSAADTILEILPAALADRQIERLQLLLEASTMANLACGNTGLGLVHALSSAPSVRLPHGYQNGALLLGVARFNRERMDGPHRHYIERVEQLFRAVGFSGKFSTNEIGTADVAAMLSASRQHPFRTNNIRASTDEEVSILLHDAAAARQEMSV